MTKDSQRLPGVFDRETSKIPLETITYEEYKALGGLPLREAKQVTPPERRQDERWHTIGSGPNVDIDFDDLEASSHYYLPEQDE